MTDEQIITRLECWPRRVTNCEERVYYYTAGYRMCNADLINGALDLINRQKKDIERLNNYKELYEDLKEENLETIRCIKQSIKSARAEAVREFAEKVKYYADGYNWLEMTCSQVDEIVKEMTEGE